MQEAIELAADSLDHLGRAMAGVQATDTPREVNQMIAVNIFDERPLGAGNEDWRRMIKAPRRGNFGALHQLLRARPGNRCAQVDGWHSVLINQF